MSPRVKAPYPGEKQYYRRKEFQLNELEASGMPQCCIQGHKIASEKSFYLQLLDHSNKAALLYCSTFSLGVCACVCV